MGKAPSAPNPTATAQAQTASNRETAVAQAGLNAVDQRTPYGNLTYTQNGTWADGTPKFTATQTLSGAGQQLFDTGQQTQQNLANLAQEQSGRLSGILNQNIDFSGLPQGGSWNDIDYSADRQRVESAMFDRLQPQIDRDRQAFETSLVNRGIRPGSNAYNDQMSQFQQGVNDQRTSVLLQGGQEQSRLHNMQLAGFGAMNTQRQNALAEMLTQRQAPLNEILALAGQGQISQPNFVNSPQTQMAGTDVAGITNAAHAQNMQAYQQNQSALGGLFSAGASLIPLLSDRSMKTDIKRVGTAFNGLPIYVYRYAGGDAFHLGFMADEVEKVHPEAVETGPDGLKRVFYSKAVA